MMNRSTFLIFVIFLIVIAGVYAVFYNPKASQSLTTDENSQILNALKKKTDISFSKIADATFSWESYNYDSDGDSASSTAVSGKQFSATGIQNGDAESIIEYFGDNGFSTVFVDSTTGAVEYEKEDVGCIFQKTGTSGSYNVVVSCGKIMN
jgi:hypothetical protein